MDTFFSADHHFNHKNIIDFCGRPFRSLEGMNDQLIRKWNSRVKEDDVVYYLGDFCFGNRKSFKYFEGQLNGKIIFVKGNHDKNNGVKTILGHMVLYFSNILIWATHVPVIGSESKYYTAIHEIKVPDNIDLILCGHVHEKWKHRWLHRMVKPSIIDIPIINIGVDVWGFAPVKMDEVIRYYDKIIKEKDDSV